MESRVRFVQEHGWWCTLTRTDHAYPSELPSSQLLSTVPVR